MSEVFSRLQGRSKFNSCKLLCQIHCYPDFRYWKRKTANFSPVGDVSV